MTTEEGVRRLERENRWMKLGGVLALITLACVVLVGAGLQEKQKPMIHDELHARAIRVYDEKGRVRGFWHANGDQSELVLCGEEEKSVACLSVGRNGVASMHLASGGGYIPIHLFAGADGHVGLYITGGLKQGGLILEYPTARAPMRLRFRDRANRLRAELQFPSDGPVVMQRFGADGRQVQ